MYNTCIVVLSYLSSIIGSLTHAANTPQCRDRTQADEIRPAPPFSPAPTNSFPCRHNIADDWGKYQNDCFIVIVHLMHLFLVFSFFLVEDSWFVLGSHIKRLGTSEPVLVAGWLALNILLHSRNETPVFMTPLLIIGKLLRPAVLTRKLLHSRQPGDKKSLVLKMSIH